MENPFLLSTDKPAETRAFCMGVITSVTGGLFVKLDGEATARTKSFKRCSTYTPVVGDRVLIASISGTYVVQGSVV